MTQGRKSLRPLGALLAVAGLLAGCGGGEETDGSPGGADGPASLSEVEPNGTLGEAQAITPPIRISGSVALPDDEYDIFSFIPEQTTRLTVTLSGFGANDLDLWGVSNADPSRYGSDIDAPWEGPEESFTKEFTAGITYYIVVEAYSTEGAASYTLSIQ